MELAEDFHKFFPASDFFKGVQYIGVTVPVRTASRDEMVTQEKPYLITSSRENFPLNDQILYRRGLSANLAKTSGFGGCHWRYTGDYGVFAWLNGNEKAVDPLDVFSRVRRLFEDHCWYPHDEYFDLLALFVFVSFWTALFDSVPYLYLNATREAGKSLTMDILAELGFNAHKSDAPSEATLYRFPESTRGMLLLDEQRRLGNQQKGGEDDRLFALLKTGYKRSGSAMICVGDDNRVENFSTFCTKVFANSTRLDTELASRVITLQLRRWRGPGLKKFIPSMKAGELATLRDQLYVLSLQHAERIAQLYRRWIPREGLTARDDEVWSAIFVVAQWLDELVEDEDVPESETLLGRMIEFARTHKTNRETQAAEEDTESQLLQSLWDFLYMDERPVPVNKFIESKAYPWLTNLHYFAEDIMAFLLEQENFSWMEKMSPAGATRRVSQDMKKLGLLDHETEKKRFVKSKRFGQVTDPKSKRRRVYRLDPDKIVDVADQRGVPLDLDKSVAESAPPGGSPEEEETNEGQRGLF